MAIVAWLKRLKRWRLDDNDFQEEIRSHLVIAADERMAGGADRQTAHSAALKEFGNVTLTIETARQVWTPAWFEALRDYASDARYAIRALAKNPAYSFTVVSVLTLGIALNVAVFALLKSVALSPLAGVEKAAGLAVIYGETGSGRHVRISYPDYQHLRDHSPAFSELFGTSLITVNLGRGRSARQLSGELVTWNYFQALGVRAEHGRTLLASDEVAPGRHPVVVISDGLWRRDFGADPDIVGKTLEINNYPLTVVGVTDPAFHGMVVSFDVELFIPVMMASEIGAGRWGRTTLSSNALSDRRTPILFPHGYLRPTMTIADAAAQTDATWTTLARDRPLTDTTQRLRVVPFWQSPVGAQAYALPMLVVLSTTGLLVLMIASANIAGLVLARGVSRRGEIALRLALGATRTRIVRLLMLESLVLAVPGAAIGLLFAWRAIPMVFAHIESAAAPLRLFLNLEVDSLIVGFAVLVACGSALIFGFVPALRISRVDLVSVMNEGLSSRGVARERLRTALGVAQVAVSLLLLVGAGLVGRSFDAAQRANRGFDEGHVTSIAFDLTGNGYDEPRGLLFYRRLLDAARAEPGIESATLAEFNPMTFFESGALRVAIDGHDARRDEDLFLLTNAVGPDYFRTLRIGLTVGRAFEDRDDGLATPVAVVNTTLAQRFWGGAANAIGKRLRIDDGDWRTVIGVAADVKYVRINEPPRPFVYLPVLQSYRPNLVLHTRGSAPVAVLVDQAHALISAVDANLPIVSATSLADQTGGALYIFRYTSAGLLIFGVAGMALAAMGIYGLVSYTIRESTHEIGIRMALGASSVSIVKRFAGQGLRLGVVGAALGVVAALGASRLLGSVLFAISATDLMAFAGALAIVLGSALAASITPAWRAARGNPVTALRHQ
jgi:predicted permease